MAKLLKNTALFTYVIKDTEQVFNTSSGVATIKFDSVQTDENNSYNTSTGVFTCNNRGTYLVYFNVLYYLTSTGYNSNLEVSLIKNRGVVTSTGLYTQYIVDTSTGCSHSGSIYISLEIGDTLTLCGNCWDTNGGSVAIGNEGLGNFLQIIKVFEFQKESIIIYNLRDTGPAGGWIFYDKGSYSDGWRWMEADISDITYVVWSNISNVLIGTTSTEIGTGQDNTTKIINQSGHTNSAAKQCTDLIVNGYNDWYLPSLDEIGLMYSNLYLFGVGNFNFGDPNSPLWSSSEYTKDYAWWWRSYSYDYYNKEYHTNIRAARRF